LEEREKEDLIKDKERERIIERDGTMDREIERPIHGERDTTQRKVKVKVKVTVKVNQMDREREGMMRDNIDRGTTEREIDNRLEREERDRERSHGMMRERIDRLLMQERDETIKRERIVWRDRIQAKLSQCKVHVGSPSIPPQKGHF
jgi:hypothetical protein